jgi:hypothetical protein
MHRAMRTAAGVCHHRAVRNGERAGGRQMIHVLAAWGLVAVAVVGSFELVVDLSFRDQDTGEYDRLPALPTALCAGVLLAFLWRLMRMGIYHSDKGVRIRTLPRTVTYRWAEITTTEARGNDLWLVLTDGREVKTPVRRMEGHQRNGIPLDSGDFNVLLNQLQHHAKPGR